MNTYKSRIRNQRQLRKLPKRAVVGISRRCPWEGCGKYTGVRVVLEDWLHYKDGDGLLQDCFPYLSARERERIKSGYCDEHGDLLFGRFMPMEAAPASRLGKLVRRVRNFFYLHFR